MAAVRLDVGRATHDLSLEAASALARLQKANWCVCVCAFMCALAPAAASDGRVRRHVVSCVSVGYGDMGPDGDGILGGQWGDEGGTPRVRHFAGGVSYSYYVGPSVQSVRVRARASARPALAPSP